MEFTESDLPVKLHHEDYVTLASGECVRFECNGEAKDVYVGDAFAPTVQLFPDTDYRFESGGANYRVLSHFEDNLSVYKL